MRRLETTLLLAAGIACAAGIPAAGAQQLLFDYVGFDYESPVVSPAFGSVGNGYNGVGEVPTVASPLVSNPAISEYTYYITGLVAVSRTEMGGYAVVDYAGPGTLTLYEDSKTSGTHFDYGVDPPNGTAPSSFTDGTPILVGSVTNFRIAFNVSSGSGSYDSDFEVIGGAQYGNIPPDERKGWQFAGVTRGTITIPRGYAHQVDGQAFLQLPSLVSTSSWGQLKRRYR